MESKLPLKLFKKGKVRDVYETKDGNLLIVSTDRVSAFDFILPNIIPDKGKVLNSIAAFWFEQTKNFMGNHVIDYSPENREEFKEFAHLIEKRSMFVKKLETLPLEAIVRGYIVGSGWKSYEKNGEICGIKINEKLNFADKFNTPLFTPSTKAEEGHDENISFDQLVEIVGEKDAKTVRNMSISLYNYATKIASEKGVIIADTKFEFGKDENGEIVLIDEIFTPDSSRFWKADDYKPGVEPPSYDKQFIRNYLLSSSWDRKSTPPALPKNVIAKSSEKYREIYKILTGKKI